MTNCKKVKLIFYTKLLFIQNNKNNTEQKLSLENMP